MVHLTGYVIDEEDGFPDDYDDGDVDSGSMVSVSDSASVSFSHLWGLISFMCNSWSFKYSCYLDFGCKSVTCCNKKSLVCFRSLSRRRVLWWSVGCFVLQDICSHASLYICMVDLWCVRPCLHACVCVRLCTGMHVVDFWMVLYMPGCT